MTIYIYIYIYIESYDDFGDESWLTQGFDYNIQQPCDNHDDRYLENQERKTEVQWIVSEQQTIAGDKSRCVAYNHGSIVVVFVDMASVDERPRRYIGRC